MNRLGLVRIAPSMAVAPRRIIAKLWVRDSVKPGGASVLVVPGGKRIN